MPIDESTLAELKAKHGNILHVETKYGHEVVFRVATYEEFNRFLEQHGDVQTRVAAVKNLLFECTVYPDNEGLQRILREKPGLLSKLTDYLTDFCGLEKDAVRKK